MIISHKYKFIFIKTAKTAGTSIEIFLSDVCGNDDVLTTIFPHVEPHVARNFSADNFHSHATAAEIKNKVSRKVWDSYFKFCVERNPWDKTLSHYHMINHRSGDEISLNDYFLNNKFCVNYPMYTDDTGKVMVDHVVRYENLVEDLSSVFYSLGIVYNGDLGVRAKADYRSDRRGYRDVFTQDQVDKVSDVFDKEIAMHGYLF